MAHRGRHAVCQGPPIVGLKVAIVGLSPTSHHLAPWDDPEWELWGMPWDVDRWKMDRLFEMHDDPDPRSEGELPEYPVLYMQDAKYPNVTTYPLEEVAATIGGDYWCSSVGYMLALAIHEGAEEIAIFGVDMKATEEYAYQRANCEYLIGLARGKGIKVHIPDTSPLCKFQSDPDFTYRGRYGRL